jgi:hypothetical protein
MQRSRLSTLRAGRRCSNRRRTSALSLRRCRKTSASAPNERDLGVIEGWGVEDTEKRSAASEQGRAITAAKQIWKRMAARADRGGPRRGGSTLGLWLSTRSADRCVIEDLDEDPCGSPGRSGFAVSPCPPLYASGTPVTATSCWASVGCSRPSSLSRLLHQLDLIGVTTREHGL